MKMHRTNCINCGAVLKGCFCEYCGSDNTVNDIKSGDIGVLRIDGVEYNVYVAEIGKIGEIVSCRDSSGMLKRQDLRKRTFKLIET